MTAPDPNASTDPNVDPNNTPDPNNDGGGEPSGQAAGDGANAPNPRVAELETKYAQAQSALAEAQNKLTALEREKMDETERTKAERDDLQAKWETAQKALQDRAIENAFLMANKVTWHNPATALRLLNREGVSVGDDGTVTGINEAIEALSKSDPYLVAAKPDEGGSKGGSKSGGSTGSQPGTGAGAQNNPAATDRAKLEKKYPALRR